VLIANGNQLKQQSLKLESDLSDGFSVQAK